MKRQMLALSKKVKITLVSMLVFFLVSLPLMYSITSSITSRAIGMPTVTSSTCPTKFGLLLHTAVFGLITYALMFVPNFP